MAKWQSAGSESRLAEGKSIQIQIAGHTLLLVRSGDEIYAISDRCSHADQELACGIIRNGWIACPAHGARFDLASGEPLNPPASQPIATYPVRLRDGTVEVWFSET